MMLGTFSLPNVNNADWKAGVELGYAQSASSLRSPARHAFRGNFSGHEHRQLYRLWNWVASRSTHVLEVHQERFCRTAVATSICTYELCITYFFHLNRA